MVAVAITLTVSSLSKKIVFSSGKRIAAELIPIIEEKERNAQCAVVPAFGEYFG